MNADSIYNALPVPLQNVACTWAGWQRSRTRFNPHFHRMLGEWTQTRKSPLEALQSIQQDRLIELVRRARQYVPHYAALGVPEPSRHDDGAKGVAEILSGFPVLEKESYRDSPDAFLASDIPASDLIPGTTSGTTGSALRLWQTRETLAEEYATVWRLRRSIGVKFSDAHFSFGGQLVVPLDRSDAPFWRRNFWSNQVLFSLYHMADENLSAYVNAMHTLPAAYVQGYPSSLYLLANAMLAAGRPLPKGKLKGIFSSSESLLAYHRRVIEKAFSAPIFDRYGTSEFAVSMTGCEEGRLHVDMEFGVVEVEIQEETDNFVRGPLLVTGLARHATPFIRYRIGDVGTRSKHACPCGRPGENFLDVDGRVEDYVVTPDGRWIGRLDHIFKEQRDVAEAQIVQEDAGAIEVRIVPRPSFDGRSQEALMKEIRARLGNEIRVELRIVDGIAREANGKFRAVKSVVGRNPG